MDLLGSAQSLTANHTTVLDWYSMLHYAIYLKLCPPNYPYLLIKEVTWCMNRGKQHEYNQNFKYSLVCNLIPSFSQQIFTGDQHCSQHGQVLRTQSLRHHHPEKVNLSWQFSRNTTHPVQGAWGQTSCCQRRWYQNKWKRLHYLTILRYQDPKK